MIGTSFHPSLSLSPLLNELSDIRIVCFMMVKNEDIDNYNLDF